MSRERKVVVANKNEMIVYSKLNWTQYMRSHSKQYNITQGRSSSSKKTQMFLLLFFFFFCMNETWHEKYRAIKTSKQCLHALEVGDVMSDKDFWKPKTSFFCVHESVMLELIVDIIVKSVIVLWCLAILFYCCAVVISLCHKLSSIQFHFNNKLNFIRRVKE